jgi:hypothetical protein
LRDGNGEIYTVRYEAVNAMLLRERFTPERRKLTLRRGGSASDF